MAETGQKIGAFDARDLEVFACRRYGWRPGSGITADRGGQVFIGSNYAGVLEKDGERIRLDRSVVPLGGAYIIGFEELSAKIRSLEECNVPACRKPKVGINGHCEDCQERYLDFAS